MKLVVVIPPRTVSAGVVNPTPSEVITAEFTDRYPSVIDKFAAIDKSPEGVKILSVVIPTLVIVVELVDVSVM